LNTIQKLKTKRQARRQHNNFMGNAKNEKLQIYIDAYSLKVCDIKSIPATYFFQKIRIINMKSTATIKSFVCSI